MDVTEGARLTLAGEQTIGTIDETARALRQQLAAHSRVVVDVGQVAKVDLSFVQLLLSARKAAVAAGRELALAAAADGPLLACLRSGGFLPDHPGEVRGAHDFWLKQ
jgi:ABC-type transporter Mla MlaB component